MEKIDIRQMRVLVLLVRYKSVSRVAELLEISQQGVSSHLKKLRDLFPAELFIRQSAGLQPTDYACDLAARFEQILADIDAYEIYCKDHKDFKNNKTKVTTERILDVYRKCVETDDFL